MSLVHSFDVGNIRCHTLEGGRQRLDGGAMFGVVPKPLWEQRIAADDRNRIPLALRCLLIEHEAGPILVDTGVGNKENEKFRGIYGVENTGPTGRTQLEGALAEAGFQPGDIACVINTHLHFDHAGGNTYIEATGGADQPPAPRVAFPNATFVVQGGELQFAMNRNERTAGSYLPHNFDPVTRAGQWQLVDGPANIAPGVRVVPTPGHVPHHQSVLVSDGGQTLCFLGDLVPTTAHLPLPWIMGYDVEPLVTLESKREMLARAVAEDWILVFEHDPARGMGKAAFDGKRLVLEEFS